MLSGIFWITHFVRLLCKWNQFEFVNFYLLHFVTVPFIAVERFIRVESNWSFTWTLCLVCSNFEPFETNATSHIRNKIKVIISLQKWEWVQIPWRLLNNYLQWIKYGVIISLQESRRLDSPLKLAGFPKSFYFSRWSHSCFYEIDKSISFTAFCSSTVLLPSSKFTVKGKQISVRNCDHTKDSVTKNILPILYHHRA